MTVWLSDRGPVFFTQVRVGKDGRAFRIYKFRTMVVDAELRKAELMDRNEHDGVLFKLHKDPRVTAIGTHLRRWSIDELPQLFNVFLGDMSLVGPRPALPAEAEKYAEHVRRRLVVKPGITGLWQVSGPANLSWDESVRLDLRYVENWSFALDLQILWKTVSAILQGSEDISDSFIMGGSEVFPFMGAEPCRAAGRRRGSTCLRRSLWVGRPAAQQLDIRYRNGHRTCRHVMWRFLVACVS